MLASAIALLLVHSPVEAEMASLGEKWNLADMSQQIRNPIAQLLQFPLEFDGDGQVGPDRDGTQIHLDMNAIVPIRLTRDWTLVAWSKIPIYWQQDVQPGSGTQVGLSNSQLRLFLTPAVVKRGLLEEGFIWGLGPMLELPATATLIDVEQVSAGYDASFCWQGRPWTVGFLGYQIFGVAGPGVRTNQAYLQPYLSYTTRSAWSATVNTESTWDSTNRDWAIPVNLEFSKVVAFGDLHVSFLLGARYWAASPDSSPNGFGGRASITFILPNLLP